MDYSKYQGIKVEKSGGVAVVTLNRPEALNAVDSGMHAELASLFEALNSDQEVRAAVLTGAGRAFSAGGDIRGMQRRLGNQAENLAILREARKIVNDMLDLEAPLIVAVNGPAVGLGATLALLGDVVIASERARFGDPHVGVGLVAGDGGAVIWPLLCGVAKAKELLMTGDIIDAREAERLRLVNRVVPENELMPAATALAARLANGPRLAISWTKQIINKLIKQNANLTLELGLAWEGHTFQSGDHREAVQAFVEKRQPRFEGR